MGFIGHNVNRIESHSRRKECGETEIHLRNHRLLKSEANRASSSGTLIPLRHSRVLKALFSRSKIQIDLAIFHPHVSTIVDVLCKREAHRWIFWAANIMHAASRIHLTFLYLSNSLIPGTA